MTEVQVALICIDEDEFSWAVETAERLNLFTVKRIVHADGCELTRADAKKRIAQTLNRLRKKHGDLEVSVSPL